MTSACSRDHGISGRELARIQAESVQKDLPADGAGARENALRLEELTVILIAPDVSEQLGGEAMKALHILRELRRLGVDVHQITHERRREEMQRIEPDIPVHYVKDSAIQRFIWKSKVLRNGIQIPFMRGAARIARGLVQELRQSRPGRQIVIHYTSPVSPVLPCFPTPEAATVIGPINGNIHYPPTLRTRERASYRLRRRLLPVAQVAHRALFRGKQRAELILVAGGQRTADSLRLAGCRPEQFLASLDSGVPNRLADLPRIAHKGKNLRFVHNGRLVTHKGLDLAIRAVARAKQPVELDIIGRGPVEPMLRELAAQLGVSERVRFLGWIEDHSKLPEALAAYRGYVFPSLAEANGIVVQEAMLLGLPVICLNWGGPALLVTPECGILVEPAGEDQVVQAFADAMDRLALDGELAERMSLAGRARAMAEGYPWRICIRGWINAYWQAMARRNSGLQGGTVEQPDRKVSV